MKKENWDQNTPSNSPRALGTKKIGKERVHREELSKSVRLMSVVLARQNAGKDHMSGPCTKKDTPTEKYGFWRKYLQAQECGQNNVLLSQFNPRCTVARLLGFCLKSSRYIVVDFNGRFRMVRTIKRANTDDRWKVVSPSDPFSAADLESTSAEFTCSRGTREEVNPTAQQLERRPVDALPPDPNRDPVQRRLYLKQSDFEAHGTSNRCPSCRALVSGGRAQGHTAECRIRVEGELRKTEEGKARLRAAASRVGDVPQGLH